jgi:hypothetical protein
VSARVRFPEGLLTEFYPPVERMEPPFHFGEKPPLKQSVLDWGDIHLIPMEGSQSQALARARCRLPESDPRFHYGHARETDSALVHVRMSKPDASTPLASKGDFCEKFLFYRGVGNFDLPLSLTATSDGSFELVNAGHEAVRSLFLVDIEAPMVRFATFDHVDPAGRLKLTQSAQPTSVSALSAAVQGALVREGLFEKEAVAMVKTWRSSWFGENGTRLFYILPRTVTDGLLPLEIDPQPERVVRVLVGRMEIMRPEEESRVTEIVQKSASARQVHALLGAAGKLVPYEAPPELASLGRLAEPALARVGTISKDAEIRSEAKLLLKSLTSEKRKPPSAN